MGETSKDAQESGSEALEAQVRSTNSTSITMCQAIALSQDLSVRAWMDCMLACHSNALWKVEIFTRPEVLQVGDTGTKSQS